MIEKTDPDQIISKVVKIAYETGKILVERRALFFLGGVIIGSLMPTQSTLACGLLVKEKALEKQDVGTFFSYIKSYGSIKAWAAYFKAGKSSPTFYYYKDKISNISPLLYLSLGTGIGTGIGLLYAKNFSCGEVEIKFLHCLKNNADLVKKVNHCVKNNVDLMEEVKVIINTLTKNLE